MARCVGLAFYVEYTGSLALKDDLTDLLHSCSMVDNLRHVLEVHVTKLLPVVSVEQSFFIEVAKGP